MDIERIEKAKQLSEKYKIKSEFIIHENSGMTTEQAEIALGVDANCILKTLILYASIENLFIGTIITGNTKLNIKSITKLAGVKKLRFADNVQIEKLTGFKIGGVPPLSVVHCNKAFIDENVILKQFVIGAGGDEFCGMKFSPQDLISKINIIIAELV